MTMTEPTHSIIPSVASEDRSLRTARLLTPPRNGRAKSGNKDIGTAGQRKAGHDSPPSGGASFLPALVELFRRLWSCPFLQRVGPARPAPPALLQPGRF